MGHGIVQLRKRAEEAEEETKKARAEAAQLRVQLREQIERNRVMAAEFRSKTEYMVEEVYKKTRELHRFAESITEQELGSPIRNSSSPPSPSSLPPMPPTVNPTSSDLQKFFHESMGRVHREMIRVSLRSDKRISAIKLFREAYQIERGEQLDLKAAKDFCDKLYQDMHDCY